MLNSKLNRTEFLERFALFRQLTLSVPFVSLCSAHAVLAQEPSGFETIKEKYSYVQGMKIATELLEQDSSLYRHDVYGIDFDALLKGMQDRIDGAPSLLTQEDEVDLARFIQLLTQVGRRPPSAANALRTGQDFLERNGVRPGVVTTASGLQYRVEYSGNGPRPTALQSVTVHYHGRLLDGTVFDSSYERGQTARFRVNEVIPGWEEALKLMNEGATYSVWIPPELAYGDAGTGDKVGPNEVLHFEIYLAGIE